jgi:carbon monoxide dehydrogenase subunit G
MGLFHPWGRFMDFTIDIARPIEPVFALIADLPNYQRWLPQSSLYNMTTQVSDNPIKLGTTYVDRSKQATLNGRITEYLPPHTVGFHQKTRLVLGSLIIDIRYRLEALGAETRVHRTTTPHLSGLLALLGPMIVRSIRNENIRTLAMMKQYLESQLPE